MAEGQDALLIDVENNTERNNLDIASGGITVPQPVGFIGFPQAPLLPNPVFNLIVCNTFLIFYSYFYLNYFFQNSEKGTIGFVTPPATLESKDQNVPYNPSNVLYNIPLDNSNGNKPVSDII